MEPVSLKSGKRGWPVKIRPRLFAQTGMPRASSGRILGRIEMTLLRKFLTNESGATAIEYGLIAALIAVVIITGVTSVGTKMSSTFVSLSGKLL